MLTKLNVVLIVLFIGILFSNAIVTSFESIPKVWDIKKLESMHLPYADSTVKLTFISEEYYNKIPTRIAYKSYPFYMPGTEPKGYYDSLMTLEPEIVFDERTIKNEGDWVKAGEVIYDMPMNYFALDSQMIALLPVIAEKWKKYNIKTKKNGVIPFVSIVVREKNKLELGNGSCGMCHTKLMPDDKLLKGAQGNFVDDLFTNMIAINSPAFATATDENKMKVFHNFVRRLYHTPWTNNKYQDDWKSVTIETLDKAYVHILPGVQSRNNGSFDHPLSIPDLYNLKERKYLDKSGHNLQRDISDLMRYSMLNQDLNMTTSFGDFIPGPRPEDPAKYFKGRFSDAQVYAIAKFLYSLETPKNPEKYSPAVLRKGQTIFIEQGCVSCHTPPLYTNNKLTPVDGFEPPASHLKKYDIFNVSVETDPGLSLYTRRGSGYYKVPSLIGAWNRTAFLHDGHLARLEDLFDPARFSPDYVPTYFKNRNVPHMAVPGHPFGMELEQDEVTALVAFIKSL